MMVANSFDLWQKDAFFSAAEEVQESADAMQSTYRMWIKEKKKKNKEGSETVSFDELSRDLQIALGTAKWQLEEFERAVMLSHGHHSDDSVATRHKQFVAAIECQISRVEADLMEALSGEGKEPLQWVNLNKEECDDLALFLSGASQTPKSSRLNSTAIGSSTRSTDCVFNSTASGSSCNEWDVNGVTSNNDEFIIHVEDRDVPRVQDDIISQADITSSGTRKTWSSPNFGGLKVVVADEDEHNDRLLTTDSTPKEKGAKSLFWRQKCGEFSRVKGSSSMFSQLFSQSGGFQRQMQLPLPVQFSCSIQLTLALMLSIFLIVPFLVYSA